MITIEMITPSIPSREMWKNMEIIAATNVESESIESKNASLPDATSACELMDSLTRLTYCTKTNLTTTATAIITSEIVV